jgi:spore coat protein CotH
MNSDSTPEGRPARAAWVTPVQVALLGIVALLCGFAATAHWPQSAARAQGPGGFPGGPPGRGFGGVQQERKILAQFDMDKNKRLSLAERKAARDWLATQPSSGPGGRRGGRGFGRGGFAATTEGRRLSPADVKSFSTAALYDPATLRTVFLQFEESDWEQALADFKNTDVDVPATVIVDGKTYKDVGVHFRGMSSYMMVPEGAKRSLNLSFDFAHDNQTLNGYRTVNLLNANGDPTFLRAVIYSEIARAYIPAPRINYMRTVINGESWGIYLNAQQFNKDFLRDNFGTEKGARWKVPGSPGGRGGMEYLGQDASEYKRIYDIRTKDDPKAWGDLIRLFRVLNETPPEKLEAALAPILDVDAALKFLAVDVALVNSDGYWTRASDYNIYQDEKGRFHVIPHDMNEALADEGGGSGGRAFGGGARGFPPPPDGGFPGGRGGGRFGGGANAELDPLVGLNDSGKALRARLLAVPALRTRYQAYVRDIAEKWLDWKKLEPIVRARQAVIAEDVKLDGRKLYSTEAFTADVSGAENSLQAFVEKRRAFLLK